MNLNLKSICECLPSNFTSLKRIENNKEQLYTFPKIFKKNMSIESNTLYIGKYKDFTTEILKDSRVAVVCVGEIPSLKSIECSFLHINENISIVEVYAAIVEIFHKYNRWEKEVLEIISSLHDLKKIIKISKPLFDGNQLNCISLNGEIIAGSINTSLVNIKTNNEHLPLPMLTQNIDKIKPSLKKGECQYGTSYINDLEFNFIQRNIYIQEQSIGLLNCTDTHHPLREIEFLLVNKLCDIIENTSAENWITKHNDKTEASSLLKSVLQGKHNKLPDLISNLQKTEISSNNYFSCICLRILDKESGIILSKFFSVNIYHYLSEAIVCTIENDIIILLHSTSKSKNTNIINEFEKLLDGCKYQIGVSNHFQNIEDIIHYFHQAIISIDMQCKLKIKNSKPHFSDVALSYIIEKATTTLPKQQLCHPGVVELYKYDKDTGSSYVSTLKCYFENKQNSTKTAECLFIHRSTLLYRLERIKEIIDDDWRTYKKQLYIMFSLYVLYE